MKKNASMIKRFVLTKENIIRNRIECLKLWSRYESAQALEEKYNKVYDIAVKMGCKDYEYKLNLLRKSSKFFVLGCECVDKYHKAYNELMKLADEGNLWATIYHMDSDFWAMSR